jgi:hypothetical protein
VSSLASSTLLTRIEPKAPLTPPLPEPRNEFLEVVSQGSSIAATEREQPSTVIISEAFPPNPRPNIILKIQHATERREKAKEGGETGRDMDID